MLKCHACSKVTTEIGKIFCPTCGNGGTLRKVAVTVSDNGIVLAARRPRISLRGTKVAVTSNNHHATSLCFNTDSSDMAFESSVPRALQI